jgi:predicted kinase
MIARVKVIVLIGLPASGKSTWAAGQRPAVTLSSDEVRRMLAGDTTDQTIHAHVFATLRFLLRRRLLMARGDTIVDATNLAPRWRRDWIRLAQRAGVPVEAVWFDTPLDVCLARNAARERVVPEAAIRAMAAQLEPPRPEEGFTRIRTIRASGRATRPAART